MSSAVLAALAAGAASVDAAGAPDAAEAACQDIEQRYTINKAEMNPRTLNFLLFDAAEADCTELIGRFLDLGASVHARDKKGLSALDLATNDAVRHALTGS